MDSVPYVIMRGKIIFPLTHSCNLLHALSLPYDTTPTKIMLDRSKAQKVLVVGAGPVGALAALYAAERGDDVHVYDLRAGKNLCLSN